MKKLFTLSALILSCLLAQAQVKTDCSRVIVGAVTTISPDLAKGLKQARYKLGNYQIALISSKPFTSCYYTIYDLSGRVICSGPFMKRHAGEVQYFNIGVLANECRVEVREKQIISTRKNS